VRVKAELFVSFRQRGGAAWFIHDCREGAMQWREGGATEGGPGLMQEMTTVHGGVLEV
jgi:hypothetical protein